MIKLILKDSGKEHVEIHLKRNGLTKKEFAEILEIDRSYLSKILQGKRSPGSKLAVKIAQEVNRKLVDLFRFEKH